MRPYSRPRPAVRRPATSTVAAILLFLAAIPLAAAAQAEPTGPDAPDVSLKPMPEVPDPRLNRILQRYYEEALGGEEKWRRLESLRIQGVLTNADGEFALKAYHKKPDFLKMTLTSPDAALVLGYDGVTAWKAFGGPGQGRAVPMDDGEARQFVFNARFDTYLVYPLASGKTVEYVDFIPTEGEESHHLRVSLDNGFVVDYFLDITSFLVGRAIISDLRTGTVNTIEYHDYRPVRDTFIAHHVVSRKNGVFNSELRIEKIEPNIGMMTWMFAPAPATPPSP